MERAMESLGAAGGIASEPLPARLAARVNPLVANALSRNAAAWSSSPLKGGSEGARRLPGALEHGEDLADLLLAVLRA